MLGAAGAGSSLQSSSGSPASASAGEPFALSSADAMGSGASKPAAEPVAPLESDHDVIADAIATSKPKWAAMNAKATAPAAGGGPGSVRRGAA